MAQRLYTDAECKNKALAWAREIGKGWHGSKEETRAKITALFYPPDAAVILGALEKMKVV